MAKFFGSLNIYLETTWERAMGILLERKYKLQIFTDLIRRRAIWLKGKNPRKIPNFSEIDIKTKLIHALEKQFRPNLKEIILFSYKNYDLTNILSTISHNSVTYTKIKTAKLDDQQAHFIGYVFKDSNILTNYKNWLDLIYNIFPQEEIIAKISGDMFSKEKFIQLPIKSLQLML